MKKKSNNVSINHSMDDVTKDRIVLVDTKGNTIGEVPKKGKSNQNPDDNNHVNKPKKQTVTIQKPVRTNNASDRPNHVTRRRLSRKERRKRKRRAIIAFIVEIVLGIAILVIGSVLFSFFFCKMENVVVEGSTIYSEEEIKGFILDGKYSDNCVYNVIHNMFNPKKDIAFIENAKVSMSGLNTNKITVTERIPIGYIAEGVPVKEASNEEQSREATDEEQVQEATDEEQSQEAADEEPVKKATAVSTGGIVKYFNEDGIITDITDIVLPNSTSWLGITASGEKVKDIIVNDDIKLDSCLTTLKALKANNIFVNDITVDDNHNIFVTKDNVKINLGLKNDMDDKCKRLSKILSQLGNQSGTLHLENFSPNNTDIVFKKET